MFTKARLTLTAWYLAIIMLISFSFSIVIYRELTNELNRFEQMHRLKQNIAFIIDPVLIQEAKDRIKMSLFVVNVAIVGASALAGYFLAGQTLKPIKEMLDEQYRFITDASHQLRTPITSLKAEIEINLRDKKLYKDTRKILTSNLEDVNNLQRLSDNLITLASYERNGTALHVEDTSLKETVDEAYKKVSAMATRKKVFIQTSVTDVTVRADRDRLIEAFVIFLDNAIKYSPSGTSITIKGIVTGHYMTVNIVDQGIGIGKHDLPHVFERFYRSNTTYGKNHTKGFGLGLSIAKHILDSHHAKVTVSSSVGNGTTFSIKLPIRTS